MPAFNRVKFDLYPFFLVIFLSVFLISGSQGNYWVISVCDTLEKSSHSCRFNFDKFLSSLSLFLLSLYRKIPVHLEVILMNLA